mmetsp:Transcript_34518/g.96850  ORF Transcript_34518/g.96850 Transcript_34518/m.96850 type:complete len:245 (-) Transcript_34518:770-1504(-)
MTVPVVVGRSRGCRITCSIARDRPRRSTTRMASRLGATIAFSSDKSMDALPATPGSPRCPMSTSKTPGSGGCGIGPLLVSERLSVAPYLGPRSAMSLATSEPGFPMEPGVPFTPRRPSALSPGIPGTPFTGSRKPFQLPMSTAKSSPPNLSRSAASSLFSNAAHRSLLQIWLIQGSCSCPTVCAVARAATSLCLDSWARISKKDFLSSSGLTACTTRAAKIGFFWTMKEWRSMQKGFAPDATSP